MESVKHRIEYALFRALTAPTALLPPKKVATFGQILGDTLYALGVRKQVVKKNLEIAFKNDKTLGERRTICRQAYRHVATVALEFILLERLKLSELKKTVTFGGLNHVLRSFDDKQGAIYACGHLGNWEICHLSLAWQGLPVHVYSGRQSNPLINRHINRVRLCCDAKLIDKSNQSLLKMFKALKNNELVAIAGDLNVPSKKLFVDFFGKQASMGIGVPMMIIRHKTAFLFGWSERVGNFNYHHTIRRIDYQLSGDKEADMRDIAQRYSKELEDVIRRIPEQYFWFNRRWKTRPVDDSEVIY